MVMSDESILFETGRGRAQSPSGDAGLGLGSGQSSCSTDVPETPRTTTLNCEDLDWPLGSASDA